MQGVRLRQSLKKLKDNNQTITETAYDLGFSSIAYFTRVFRKRNLILPTLFVKLSAS
ncbi:helix-turn-helix domain-containing protein [Labilibaculum sp.]|uniref:helix-turn-helix domain-containing protein n=1 Tax=Labilibaculum sp. TaxID=2060723 RepID=UPI0035647293